MRNVRFIIIKLQDKLYSYIDLRTQAIAANYESGFELLLHNMKNQIEIEISEKEQSGENLMQDVNVLSKQISLLKNYMDQC